MSMQTFKTMSGKVEPLWDLKGNYCNLYHQYRDQYFKGGYVGDIQMIFCGKLVPYSLSEIEPIFFTKSPIHVVLTTPKIVMELLTLPKPPSNLIDQLTQYRKEQSIIQDTMRSSEVRMEAKTRMESLLPEISRINFLNRVRATLKIDNEPYVNVKGKSISNECELSKLYKRYTDDPESGFKPLEHYVANQEMDKSLLA